MSLCLLPQILFGFIPIFYVFVQKFLQFQPYNFIILYATFLLLMYVICVILHFCTEVSTFSDIPFTKECNSFNFIGSLLQIIQKKSFRFSISLIIQIYEIEQNFCDILYFQPYLSTFPAISFYSFIQNYVRKFSTFLYIPIYAFSHTYLRFQPYLSTFLDIPKAPKRLKINIFLHSKIIK